jgi:hypothetical protein
VPVATRAVALVVALFGFGVFVTQKSVFASFAAMLLAGGALMIAFPSLTRWLAGEGLASEPERTLRSDVVTCAVAAAICAAFFVLGPRHEPGKCGGPIDGLFGYCVATSE